MGCSGSTTDYKVVKISDGDTIGIVKDNKTIKIRIAEIDCPEKGQPYGNNAKQFTAKLVFDQRVQIKVIKEHDQYGRVVAEVILADGRNLGHELVKAGLAWHYKQFSKSIELENLENDARINKRGLWQDANPEPPWEYRKKEHERRRISGDGKRKSPSS